MCPVCVANAVLAGTAVSSGGLTALAIKIFARRVVKNQGEDIVGGKNEHGCVSEQKYFSESRSAG
jgi:hypothetical protein